MPESTKPAKSTAPAPGHGEYVPWWLLILVVVLLLGVVGLGAFMVYARVAGTASERATVTEIERWEAEVKADPSNTKSIVALAYAYQKQREYEMAVETYTSAINLEPDNIGALYNRGVCLMELGREAEAERSFLKVLAVAPKHSLAAAALGQYYIDTKQYDKIASAVEQASAANPSLADLHTMLGVGYEHDGRTQDAIREYEAALKLSPELKMAKDGLARVKGQ
ncbi:MAG TPA: tetratricopeptide repeat protein [Coriobacteriia bacterium]|nr:tetratricopeptide repeat protein [Coriobacteriia bacterium]